jgi:hypothetical protein
MMKAARRIDAMLRAMMKKVDFRIDVMNATGRKTRRDSYWTGSA